MKGPLSKPTVKLIGQDGNAFSIMGRVKKALMQAGADKEYIDKYLKESTVGDYSYLLAVSMEYVNVEKEDEIDHPVRAISILRSFLI